MTKRSSLFARPGFLAVGLLAFVATLHLGRPAWAEGEWGVYPKLADSDAFLEAVRSGEVQSVARQLDERPELLACGDDQGRSAFVLAYLHEQEPVAQLLLRRGYVTDLVDAALIPDWDRVQLILDERPARVNEYHPIGGTVLYAAARMGHSQLWRLQVRGADPNANPRGAEGVTAAFGAIECRDPVNALLAAVSLFSEGADVNAPQRSGRSALHAAVERGHAELVRYLIRRGAALDARDAQGKTPLELAEAGGSEAVAKLLREQASIPRDTQTSRFAYDAAGEPFTLPDLSDLPLARRDTICRAAHKDFRTVTGLLEADPRLVLALSSQDELAVEAAAHSGRYDIAHLLLDRGAPQSLATSIAIGDLERARKLLEEDPTRIHERGPHDYPMMWYCAIGGAGVEAAQLLVEFGAEIDQESVGTTALHWAAREGDVDLARYLLEHGANWHAVGYQFSRGGKTAVEVARSRKERAMAQFLEHWISQTR